MNDFNTIHALYHSEMAKRELERRKRNLEILNTDFLVDLPSPIRDIVDQFRWGYSSRKWFPEAWEEYRKHVLEAGLGGKIKMPGAVFNKYLDKYELKELEKEYNTSAMHSEELCEDYLAHHGIKGQKWGIRRFQNDDGTLTEEGKARYGVDENGNMSEEGKALYKKEVSSTLKEEAKGRKKTAVATGTALGAAVVTGTYAVGKLLSKLSEKKVKDMVSGNAVLDVNVINKMENRYKAGTKLSTIFGKTDKEGNTHFSIGKAVAGALLLGSVGSIVASKINKKKKEEQQKRDLLINS